MNSKWLLLWAERFTLNLPGLTLEPVAKPTRKPNLESSTRTSEESSSFHDHGRELNAWKVLILTVQDTKD